jgi:hypothetical protein
VTIIDEGSTAELEESCSLWVEKMDEVLSDKDSE